MFNHSVCVNQKYPSQIILLFFIVIACLLIMIYSFKQTPLLLFNVNPKISFNICDLSDREYIFKPFFNAICNENPRNKFQFSVNSKSHICDQLYPHHPEKGLYSQLLIDIQTFSKRKIVKEDIENISASYQSCHHIQIINNTLYHIPRKSAADYQTRSRSVKTMLKLIIETFQNITDMDLFFNVQDVTEIPEQFRETLFNVPVFALTKSKKVKHGLRHENIILMPCFTLWSWPEARAGRWKGKLNSILNAGLRLKFEERTSKAFWRGVFNNEGRTWFHSLSVKYPNLVDVQQNVWSKHDNALPLVGSEAYTTLEDHCKFKYLLHIEGGSYSSRLKYLLLCGSTVIYDRGNHWDEYWYHLLEHNQNVILFEKRGNEDEFKKLHEFLSKNEDKAKEIGNQGRQLVSHYLSENAISCFWWKILDEYGKLIGYKPTLHPDAIPMEDYLLGR